MDEPLNDDGNDKDEDYDYVCDSLDDDSDEAEESYLLYLLDTDDIQCEDLSNMLIRGHKLTDLCLNLIVLNFDKVLDRYRNTLHARLYIVCVSIPHYVNKFCSF